MSKGSEVSEPTRLAPLVPLSAPAACCTAGRPSPPHACFAALSRLARAPYAAIKASR